MKYDEQIAEVYKRICPYIKKTPLLASPFFSQKMNCTLLYKCENLQYTNSFKVRGAFNKVTHISDKNKILITASAGNHGAAVSYAAKKFGMKAIVIVPEFVPSFRINKIKNLGADVIVYGKTTDDSNAKVAEYAADPRYVYVHAFDDDDIIAGQATIAYELFEEAPDLDVIVVPIGGGGLIAGIAQYAKSVNPAIEIYGVEPIGADAMLKSLEADKIITLSEMNSIAISLSVPKVAKRTFEIVKKSVNQVVSVTDELAVRELKSILEHDKLFVEPASSCALSAIIEKKIGDMTNKKVAVILSGGNFSLEQLKAYL